MKVRLVVVADDITGANDTGVQFTKHGLETVVITDLASLGRAMKDAEVVVIDTETRGCGPDTSYNRLRRVGEEVRKIGAPLIYKKIDSTLRGSIGQELDALMDALNIEASAIAPAYPANRRVTVGGYQLVDQVPVGITEASQDPSTPVTCSHVPTLLASQTKRRVCHIGLSQVMDGPRLEDELRKVKVSGGVCVLDSATQGDLRRIARALSRVGWTGLIGGPAGLAAELPEAFGMVKSRPGVAIWGSMSGKAMMQLKRAEAVMEIRAVELDLRRILRHGGRDEEVSRVVREVSESVKSGKDSIVASASSKEAVDEALTCGKEIGLSAAEVGVEIASTLGEISARVAGGRISGLIFTGGAVAVRCLESMGVKAVKLIEEVSPGIPLGEVADGRFGGLKIITKAGGFGDEDALVVCFEHLKRRWKGDK